MKTPSPRALVLPLVLLLLAGLIVLVAKSPRSPETVPEVKEASTAVRTITVTAAAQPDVIRLSGRLAPVEEAVLATEKPGLVRKVHVDKGVRVAAGDLLLELDSVLWTSALHRAELELAEAERDLARWKELSRSGAVAATELDRLQTRRDLAEVAVRENRSHLEKCQVRAPGAGWIDRRFLSEGEFAPEGADAYRWIVLDPVKVVFDLPERDAGALTVGQPQAFVLDGAGGERTGTVTFVAAAAMPENNAFRVELTAPNPDGSLKPGMLARIPVTRRLYTSAIRVPMDAIVPHKDIHVAYVAEDGRALRRVVKLAGLLEGDALVAEGLKPGDALIVEGNRALGDGSAIRIVEKDSGTAP